MGWGAQEGERSQRKMTKICTISPSLSNLFLSIECTLSSLWSSRSLTLSLPFAHSIDRVSFSVHHTSLFPNSHFISSYYHTWYCICWIVIGSSHFSFYTINRPRPLLWLAALVFPRRKGNCISRTNISLNLYWVVWSKSARKDVWPKSSKMNLGKNCKNKN